MRVVVLMAAWGVLCMTAGYGMMAALVDLSEFTARVSNVQAAERERDAALADLAEARAETARCWGTVGVGASMGPEVER